MEEHTAIIVILAFGAFVSLLYKLSYHGRRSGIDQHYGYGPMPNQYYYQRPRRSHGIGAGAALLMVTFFTFLFFFGSYSDQDISVKENYNDLGWTGRMNKKQEQNYQYEEEVQYAENDKITRKPNQEANLLPALGTSPDHIIITSEEEPQEEEVLAEKNIRIQVIAGNNEHDAIDTAQEMKEKTGLNAYVMLEIGGGAQSYKVMLGEFENKTEANQTIKRLEIKAFPKDISEKEYEEIAKY